MIARIEFIENQREYCEKRGLQLLLPTDGFCPNCGADIVSGYVNNYYQGDEKQIKYCPYCKHILK